MPGPEQLIRTAITLPVAIVRRVAGVAWSLVPGVGDDTYDARTPAPDPEPVDLDIAVAADDALTRERDPVEEAAPVAVEDPVHVEPEVELVAESADPGATEPPGAEVHVDDDLLR